MFAAALHSLPLRCEFVVKLQAVDLEIVDRFDLRRCCCSLEPRSTAPRILVGDGHKSVVDGILMDVAESGQITFLVGKSGVTKVVPYLSSGSSVQFINPLRGLFVQATKQWAETGSVVFILR